MQSRECNLGFLSHASLLFQSSNALHFSFNCNSSMGNKRKKRDESDVETTRETVLATPEGLEPNNRKKQKKRKKQTTTESNKLKHKEESFQDETTTALNKRIDELSNHLKEITEIVKKLEKNSEKNSELVAISLKEKETLPVVEHECCYESEDSFGVQKNSIFVRGFDCSFPKEDIKSALRKHFSSCGTVYYVYLPFHCKSGHPVGHAFLNVSDSEVEKALALDKSCLGGKKLLVAMAKDRREYYYGNDNLKGCERCGIAFNKRISKKFYERQLFRIQLNKEDQEAVANNDERN